MMIRSVAKPGRLSTARLPLTSLERTILVRRAAARARRSKKGHDMQCTRLGWTKALLAAASLLSLATGASADDRKQLAFEVIDRNATQMTDLSDSIYYFGETGM